MSAAIKELLGDQLQTSSGVVDLAAGLGEAKYIGLYFSAHWCPPCRGFTPKLSDFHKDNAKNKEFQIVFISSDRDQDSFDDYFKEMPWTALPFSDRERKSNLGTKYGVQGIPTLIWLDAQTGEIVQKDGRSKVMSDPQAAEFPWK